MSLTNHYFSHDCNARLDDKVLRLRAKYGWKGYGLFWGVLEVLTNTSKGGFLYDFELFAMALGIEKENAKAFLEYCIKIELFYVSEGYMYSKRINEWINQRNMFVEQGKKGALKRWGNSPPISPPYSPSDSPPNAIKKRKENKEGGDFLHSVQGSYKTSRYLSDSKVNKILKTAVSKVPVGTPFRELDILAKAKLRKNE